MHTKLIATELSPPVRWGFGGRSLSEAETLGGGSTNKCTRTYRQGVHRPLEQRRMLPPPPRFHKS